MLAAAEMVIETEREETRKAHVEARLSTEAERAATGAQVEELKAMLATAREEARVSRQVALASAEAEALETMLATAREVARASAEAEVAATGSQVGELKVLLAAARDEAREARQVALASAEAEEAAVQTLEEAPKLASRTITQLQELVAELERKLEAATTAAQLDGDNQKLQACPLTRYGPSNLGCSDYPPQSTLIRYHLLPHHRWRSLRRC